MLNPFTQTTMTIKTTNPQASRRFQNRGQTYSFSGPTQPDPVFRYPYQQGQSGRSSHSLF